MVAFGDVRSNAAGIKAVAPDTITLGKGKGAVEYWVCPIQPGKVLFEVAGVPEATAREAFRLAAAKLSVTTTFVRKAVI